MTGAGTQRWIGRPEIETIEGALKASAYVARAYKHSLENGGASPAWAKKLDSGRWLFDADYVESDARENRETV